MKSLKLPKSRKKQSNLSSLLNKELRLAASPLTWLFLVFSFAPLLTGFPILTGALLVCIGIFYSVYRMRETGDVMFTLMLPLAKRDVVRGKYTGVCCFELISFVIMAVLTALRMTVLPAEQGAAMPAGPVFLALALLMFAAFNLLFLNRFYRGGMKSVGSIGFFLVIGIALIAVGEGLNRLPAAGILWQRGGIALAVQLGILAAAIAAYIGLTVYACRESEHVFQNFEF